MERRVADSTILDVLNFYPTHPGDVFFIPAGTVHAIGKGNLICEIQQSSNSTYRLYDYDRRDRFGNPRELHLQKALSVLDYSRYEPANFEVTHEDGQKTIRCKYFETAIVSVDGEKRVQLEADSFRSILCIDGSAVLSLDGAQEVLHAGESLFVSAADTILTITGNASLLISRI